MKFKITKLAFRKIFLFTIFLSLLSLIVAIIIQVNWIYSLNKVNDQNLQNKINLAIHSFIEDYLEQEIKMLDKNFSYFNQPQDTLKQHFNASFKKVGLENIDYQFAIKGEGGLGIIKDYYLYQTKHFEENQTDNYYIYETPIDINRRLQSLFTGNYILITQINKTQSPIFYNIAISIFIGIMFTLLFILTLYLYIKTIVSERNVNKLKTDFVNNMTHELKTPLATIGLSADALCQDVVLSKKQKILEFAQIIKVENKRMLSIVERVLEAGRLEKQELILQKEPIDIHTIIQGVLGFFKPLLNDTYAAVEVKEKAIQHIIVGDKFHLQQAFSNIIDNAVKYQSKERPLKIRITTENKNHYLLIKIKDNGLGIEPEDLLHVFERFYRTYTGNIHNVKGFGLGLSYVKYVIEKLGGKVTCSSILNKETIFFISLPLK
ncbi:MAG: sensor histidine kinase [Chitinophagaceae bacterium]